MPAPASPEEVATPGLDPPPPQPATRTALMSAAAASTRAHCGVSLLTWMLHGTRSPWGLLRGYACCPGLVWLYAMGGFSLVSLYQARKQPTKQVLGVFGRRSAGARPRLSASPHVSYLAPARRPLSARRRRWEGTAGGLEPRLAPAQANGPGVGNADGRCRAAHRCRGSHRQRRLDATHAAAACAPGRRPAPADVVA
jgi:hypothetical protein